jgi:hypothetical protein
VQANILWTGLAYYSLENCVLTRTDTGTEVNSVIIGMYKHKIYKAEYSIIINENWETKSFELKTQLSDKRNVFSYSNDGKEWSKNGIAVNELKGCIDIDISITPFTNTLPINRIGLAILESRQIDVLYLDVLNQQVRLARQKYTRVSQTEYKYENVPNDFEAIITVDELGLVVNYPELFIRTAMQESNYK